MPGRPKIFDENEIIAKAGEVFWRLGYEAASTEDLLQAMGIGKGSFYLSFKGGKKELFEKALIKHASNLVSGLKKNLSQSNDPIADLKKFFFDLADADDDEKLKGCFIANSLAEMAGRDEATMELTSKLLHDLQDAFSVGIKRAQALGTVKNIDAALISRHLLNLWNGLSLSRRMYSRKELREILKINLQVLG
ncbi:TetR/AcrR family transcriptional regulator [Flavihumibacter solisilvae]|uniref:Uncharacterized protein n=1 Tax=Flavihumibacter solisilvae TaxID=1349421 RepID=A0A0C1IMK4_9BACT|nr:TetR/AcrR family transcriptional regulator [Flavihumibacter solisilvae]KIC95465.1 hypothetical protein OI18_06165 [Flavihumibacter solisilvae]